MAMQEAENLNGAKAHKFGIFAPCHENKNP
jgi:hypothetical protein